MQRTRRRSRSGSRDRYARRSPSTDSERQRPRVSTRRRSVSRERDSRDRRSRDARSGRHRHEDDARSRSRSPRRKPHTRHRSRSTDRRDDSYGVRHGQRRGEFAEDGRRHNRRDSALSDSPPELWSIHRARVVLLKTFGVFVALEGYRRQGLVHHTQIGDDISFANDDEDELRMKALEWTVPVGNEVWVKVIQVREDPSGGGTRISCSMKAVDQNTGEDLDPMNKLTGDSRGGGGGGGRGPKSDSPPPLHAILQGTVTAIKPFGVFVDMAGYRSWGLVHSSQVANNMEFSREDTDEDKVAELSGVVEAGDTVWVKVVEVTEAEQPGGRFKVGCSMKAVRQSDGTDLDPNNLQYRPRGKPGDKVDGMQERVAVVDGSGKIDWGYLKGGDKKFGGGRQQYDYVSDEESPTARPTQHQGQHHEATTRQPMPPRGRGRDMVKPAWMTDMEKGGDTYQEAAVASDQQLPAGVNSLEEALAILAKYKGDKKKKSKKKKDKKEKDKKGKKDKKDKKKHKKKSGKEKSKKHNASSSNSSGATTDAGD